MEQYYVDSAALAALCAQARSDGRLGLDVEFIREKTYYPQLALIQLAVGGTFVLVDPQRGIDLTPLDALVSDPSVTKILHAGTQDLEIFHHRTGEAPRSVLDTQIAAAMLGLGNQVSYGALVSRVLDLQLEKGESFTDWLRRPLTAKQEKYALDDVISLLPLHDALTALLAKLGREAWVVEECRRYEDVSYYVTDPREVYRKVRRFGTLDPRGQAVLRELAAWRELEARRRDRPRRNVISDEVLIELARRRPSVLKEIEQTRGLHPREFQRSGRALLESVAIGAALPREKWPVLPSRRKLTTEEELLQSFLDAFLKAECLKQEIAPGMVTNADGVEGLVRAFTEDRLESLDRAGMADPAALLLSGWRRTLIGERLLVFLTGKVNIRVDPVRKQLTFDPR